MTTVHTPRHTPLLFGLLFFILGGVIPASAAPMPPTLQLNPTAEQSRTCREVVRQLSRQHYRSISINNNLSARVLEAYLDDLDPTRSYFTRADIDEFNRYRTTLDESLKSGDLGPAFAIFNRYRTRVSERLIFVIADLEDGIDDIKFNGADALETDREDLPWPADTAALNTLWKERLKGAVLNLKLTGKEPAEIQKTLLRRYRTQLTRTGQFKPEDAFQIYLNAYTQLYDPHTQYFSPRDSENFNINMSLSLEGIGAMLRTDDEYTKVVNIVPAGPADKSGLLKPDDRIVGVAQGQDGEMVDVIGWRIDEVVDLIRGPKNTVVRLNIIPANAVDEHETRAISITRNTVKLEEQAARADTITVERDGKTYTIGVIDLPAFYLDFEALRAGRRNYRSTTRDVERLINELNAEGVDGLIIDLRENGGGSLQEVSSLVGLFIKRGPTVQIRQRGGRVHVLRDRDSSVAYDGPLAVVINRLSASASEIFAGAIQDYDRGIVIGEPTFGKGTVQTMIPLDHGQLKATSAKFYRISGTSTQHRGVTPDLSYPSLYDPKTIGESALDDALPFDTITPAAYRPWADLDPLLPTLRSSFDRRIAADPDYAYRLALISHLKDAREQTAVSLNEKTRINERDSEKQWRLLQENTRRQAKKLPSLKTLDELDAEETPRPTGELDVSDDDLLIQSAETLADIIPSFATIVRN